MWCLWARLGYNPTTDLPFLLATKKLAAQKACEFCFIWPSGKHMSLHPACILPRRWTAAGALESIPAHLSRLQCLQTKSLVTALPFLGVLHLPTPHPPPIVTSDMLLWCLRHIFLMFYTPYNPRCAEKAHFTCWHNWWCPWPCVGQADNEVFLYHHGYCENTRADTHTYTHTDNPTYVDAVGLTFVSCVFQDGPFQMVLVFAKKKKKISFQYMTDLPLLRVCFYTTSLS